MTKTYSNQMFKPHHQAGRRNTPRKDNGCLRIIKDPLPVEVGGYAPGTVFTRTDMLQMLEYSAFSVGTLVEYHGCRYNIITITKPTGTKQTLADVEIIRPRGE